MEEEQLLTSPYLAFSMMQQQVIVAFGGISCHALNLSILGTTEHGLHRLGERRGIRKRVVNVIMECLANLANHSYRTGSWADNCSFILSQSKEYYQIEASNRITEEEKTLLTNSLNRINSLDNEQLKELYCQVLSSDVRSPKGGAGLGLIDMRRRTNGQKLDYQFSPLDDDTYMFHLQIRVPRIDKTP
jgi:hypothetical protein